MVTRMRYGYFKYWDVRRIPRGKPDHDASLIFLLVVGLMSLVDVMVTGLRMRFAIPESLLCLPPTRPTRL